MTTAPGTDPFDNGWSDVRTMLAPAAVTVAEVPAPEVSHADCDRSRQELQAEIGSLTRQIEYTKRATAEKTAAEEAQQRGGFGGWIDNYGAWVALYATIGLTASGEYSLAVLVGWPRIIAWLLPTAIDIYVTVALRRHRDLIAALGLMVVVNVVYHLASQHIFGTTPDGAPTWWLIAGAATIAPYVMWRVHHLNSPETVPAETPETVPQRDGETAPETRLTATAPRVSETPQRASHETRHALPETSHETARAASHETPHPSREIACETASGQRETAVSAPVETPRTNRSTGPRHSRPKPRTKATETPVHLLPIDEQMRTVGRLINEHGTGDGLLAIVAKELGVSKATAGRRVQNYRKPKPQSA